MKRIILLPSLCIVFFTLMNLSVFAQENFYTGSMQIRIDDYGALRLLKTTDTDTIRQIDRLTALVAGNPNQVFDYYEDADVESPTTLVSSPELSDYEITGSYNNLYSGLPPNVIVRENFYGWNNGEYVLIKYTLISDETADQDFILGYDVIPQIDGEYGYETVIYDQTEKLVKAYKSGYIGFKFLNPEAAQINYFLWFDGYDNDTTYYEKLTSGIVDSNLVTDGNGSVIIMGTPTINLSPGDSTVLYFAVAYGDSESAMMGSMSDAISKYQTITDVRNENLSVPLNYSLSQNYPNPFNPSTRISFSIPKQELVTLKVYNLLGEEVTTIVNSQLNPGKYNVELNANKFSSGIYFYTINAGNFTSTKKMILIK